MICEDWGKVKKQTNPVLIWLIFPGLRKKIRKNWWKNKSKPLNYMSKREQEKVSAEIFHRAKKGDQPRLCVYGHMESSLEEKRNLLFVFSFSIPNLQEGDQAPCIPVYGRSLLPHCHFDLEDSDYISRICCNPELRGPLDPNTRVIEFNTIGLSSPSTRYQRCRMIRGFYVHQWGSKHFKAWMCVLGLLHRCFSVLNPTSKLYSFKWKCEDTGGSPFRCLTPCGTILPGKKVEVRVEALHS